MRFKLTLLGTTIPIGEAGAVLGRSRACNVRLDGEGVSRRHARLVVNDDIVLIEDLGSVLGVIVNGEPIADAQPLKNGDVITIGIHELRFSAQHSTRPPPRKGPTPLDRIWDNDEDECRDGEPTCRDSLVVMVTPDVANLLEAGRLEEAEHLFALAFDSTLNAVRRTRSVETTTNKAAATLALRLARASGRKRWVDSLLELQVAARRAPPVELLGELAATVEEVGTTKVEALRSCLGMARAGDLKPDDAADKALARLDEMASSIAADGGGYDE